MPEKLAKLDPSSSIKKRNLAMGYEEVDKYLDFELKGFERIAGYDRCKKLLKINILDEIDKEKRGIDADIPGAILLFGPSGNGKSTFAKAFIEESGCIPVEMPDIIPGNSKIEKSENFISLLNGIGEKAQESFNENNQRTIIFIDELDYYITNKSEVAQNFFDFIEDCSTKYHCTVFATTNFPQKIINEENKENFPVRIAIEPPSKDEMQKILYHHASLRVKDNENIDYNKLLEQMFSNDEGVYNSTQVRDLCKELHKQNPEGITTELISEYLENNAPLIDSESVEDFNTLITNLI